MTLSVNGETPDIHNVNGFKHSLKECGSEVLDEYKKQLNIAQNTVYNSMYSNCIESFDFAGCTYFCANNPNFGRYEVNVGDVTPDKIISSRHNWEQNVSLNPNCTVNQKFVAVASQHNDTVIGEVQPQHQCPYFDCTRSQSGMNTKVLSLCNSNSNWTFIELNLPNRKGTLRRNKTKTVNQSQCPGTEKSSAPRRTQG